ncbi:hypothetical protein AGRO_2078 [Agrobacterium sp. ATCC 31749]|nr:hypothetical protein AGRO_2078 [Agrobacterium sp. ATCC 31749]
MDISAIYRGYTTIVLTAGLLRIVKIRVFTQTATTIIIRRGGLMTHVQTVIHFLLGDLRGLIGMHPRI